MRPAKRTNQGGSVLVYTIVAVVLALLVVGAVYTVNKLSYTGNDSGEVAVETDDESTSQSTDDSDKADKKTDKSTQTDKTDKKPAKNTEKDTDSSSVTGPVNGDNDSSSHSKSEDTSSKQKVDELPQTGPADAVYTLVALSAVSFAVASYVQSRRFVA